MFNVWSLIEKMYKGEEIILFSAEDSKLTLKVQKVDNSMSPYVVWEEREEVSFVGGKPQFKSSSQVKGAQFSLEGLKMLHFGEDKEDLQKMILFKYISDKETFQSLSKFDPEEDLELFVLEHLDRFFVCGLEGLFFEIPEEELTNTLKRLYVQRVLHIHHLLKVPEGLEKHI
jgi:hypothetical protein